MFILSLQAHTDKIFWTIYFFPVLNYTKFEIIIHGDEDSSRGLLGYNIM